MKTGDCATLRLLRTTLRDRLSCSLRAVGGTWFVSGIVFAVVIKGQGTVGAWLIWGTPFFVAGWILVGLPFVALGDRVFRMSTVSLATAAGVGGALVMELPTFVVWALSPNIHYAWSVQDFRWPSLAFVIAASTAWLYRTLLRSRSPIADNTRV